MRIDGEKLRKARLDRFLDVTEVAEASGLSRHTISKIEGASMPVGSHPSTIRKLAEAIGIDPHDLVLEENDGAHARR